MNILNILKIFSVLLCGFLCLASFPLLAQGGDSPEEENDTSRIDLIFSRKMKGAQSEKGDYMSLQGDVHLQQQNMHLWCDTAYRYPDKQVTAWGNVQMLQNDSIRVFSDSLFYDGNQRKAKLSGEVVLQDSTMTMFTDQLLYDLNTKIATYPMGALIVTDSSQLVSKSGSYDANTNMAYFSDSVRLTDPNYKLFADSLAFDTKDEIAYFIGPTFIFNEEDMIYCEDGYFDNRKNYAVLTGNHYYLKRNEEGYKKATGDTIIYDGTLNKYYLIGNAVYEDGDKEMRADTIERDGATNQFYFKGNPKFRSLDSTQSQTIDSEYSFYDEKTETAIFRGNVRVTDKSQVLAADSLDYTRATRIGIARGKVVWDDSSSNVRILCGEAIYNDSTGAFLAKDRPVLVTKLDKDSLWMTADTLRALPEGIDKDKKTFFAYNHVKIFKSDVQGLCDSLTYSQSDSLFQFFKDPVLWVDSVQFTADTIRASMSDGKINKVNLHQNSLIISTPDQVYFNQIQGRNMQAYFFDNKLQHLDVQSNGKAIYYVQDDQKRYMGVNDVDCGEMFMYFAENQIRRIKFTGEPKAVLYPMGQTDHTTLRLKSFKWMEEQRPKSKFEIIGDRDWSYRLSNLSPESLLTNPPLPPGSDSIGIDSVQQVVIPEVPKEPKPGKGDKMNKGDKITPVGDGKEEKPVTPPVSKGSKMKKDK